MLPVSGAEQLNTSGAMCDRPMISHSGAYSKFDKPAPYSLSGRNRFHKPAARALGFRETCTDYREVLARRDIDAVVVATPNFLHREIVLAALAAGKHVLCEKPLALNREEAEEMLRAAERAGRVHMTAFTYRFTPAIQYARYLIEQGELGQLRTVRAAYLMALAGHVLAWRSEKRLAGSGVLADIGSHLVHITQYLVGDIRALTASERRVCDGPAARVAGWIGFFGQFSNEPTRTFE